MDGHAHLKRLAHAGGFHACTYAAPESSIEQNHVDSAIQYIGGELLEIHHHRIRRKRNANHVASSAHAVHAVNGVFQIVVAQILNALAEANGLFGGEHAVG